MTEATMPEFPALAGTANMSSDTKSKIASAAWAQSHGNQRAFAQLCAEHVRGEINLFSESPTSIRVRGKTPAVGSDRLTATGGETQIGTIANPGTAATSATVAGQTLAPAPEVPAGGATVSAVSAGSASAEPAAAPPVSGGIAIGAAAGAHSA
jgi:hypothetical protein